MNNCLVLALLFGLRFGSSIGDEDDRDQYDNEKRLLMDTTTSHFGVGNLGAMDLETRVQRLEDENKLEMELLYRLSRELTAVHSEMNATINRDLFSRLSRELSAVHKSLNETIIRQKELDAKLSNMKLGNVSYDGRKIRLVNGSGQVNSVRGTVEIFHNNFWGTVCDDGFQQPAATVVCHMLGWENPTAKFYLRAHYGQGHGHILLDEVVCTGHEKNLWDCKHLGWYHHDCIHREDVGVDCFSSSV